MHFRDQPLFGQALREAGSHNGHGLISRRRGFSFRDVAIFTGKTASKRLNDHERIKGSGPLHPGPRT